MLNTALLESITLATILGFMIGLQREVYNKSKNVEDFGGARTFALIALIGMLLAWLGEKYTLLVPVGVVGLTILLSVGYLTNAAKSGDSGLTTEFSALASFVIGMLCFTHEVGYAVFSAIMILFVLNLKEKLSRFEGFIEKKDINAAILLALMCGVIFPFIPNQPIDPWGYINLYAIWLMVILVAGISFLGYIAFRLFGDRKGTLLTGIIGGLASSTAVALAMAKKSQEDESLSDYFAVSVMIASSVMLIRAFIEVFIMNVSLAMAILPWLTMAFLGGLGVVIFFLMGKRSGDPMNHSSAIHVKNPFELSEALILGLMFGIIMALIRLSNDYAPDFGLYVISFLSGLADVDAIVLTLSTAKNTIPSNQATIAILLAIMANSWVKFGIVAVIGSSRARKVTLVYFSVISVLILASIVFI